MKKFQLESYRAFPYIAWTTFILFALFVYNITLDLQAAIADLQSTTQNLEQRISTDELADTEVTE